MCPFPNIVSCAIAGLEAMEAALELEKKVNQSLLELHKTADKHGDYQVNKVNVPCFMLTVKGKAWGPVHGLCKYN